MLTINSTARASPCDTETKEQSDTHLIAAINNVSQNSDYSQSQQIAIATIERQREEQEREDYELALSLQDID